MRQRFLDRRRIRHLRIFRREIPQLRNSAHGHVQHMVGPFPGIPAVLQQKRGIHVHAAPALRRIKPSDVAGRYGAGELILEISGHGKSLADQAFLPALVRLDVAVRIQQPVLAEAGLCRRLLRRRLRCAAALCYNYCRKKQQRCKLF